MALVDIVVASTVGFSTGLSVGIKRSRIKAIQDFNERVVSSHPELGNRVSAEKKRIDQGISSVSSYYSGIVGLVYAVGYAALGDINKAVSMGFVGYVSTSFGQKVGDSLAGVVRRRKKITPEDHRDIEQRLEELRQSYVEGEKTMASAHERVGRYIRELYLKKGNAEDYRPILVQFREATVQAACSYQLEHFLHQDPQPGNVSVSFRHDGAFPETALLLSPEGTYVIHIKVNYQEQKIDTPLGTLMSPLHFEFESTSISWDGTAPDLARSVIEHNPGYIVKGDFSMNALTKHFTRHYLEHSGILTALNNGDLRPDRSLQ